MTDDLGYFGPGSVTWRVLADPAAAVGGVRALFLQALHPLTMAGVHEHAGFETDFWPRLQRTAQYVTTVGFGTRAQADAPAARVRAVHRAVRGVDPVTGGRYAATDPDLLRWVHVTDVAPFLDARGALRLAVPPLSLRTELTTPARPLWTTVAGLAFALLPRWARRLYGLPGLPTTDLTATVVLRGLRAAALRLPERWRQGPIVQQAMARAREAS